MNRVSLNCISAYTLKHVHVFVFQDLSWLRRRHLQILHRPMQTEEQLSGGESKLADRNGSGA